jgi:amidohydrolase
LGKLGFRAGAFMASTDTITIRLHGTGGHGAMPQRAIDPVVVAAALVMALQTIVSRNVSPLDTAVVTVGALLAGDAANVIPASAELRLTVRALKADIRELLHLRIRQLAEQHAAAYGAHAEVIFEHGYPVLINDDIITHQASLLARECLGASNVLEDLPRSPAARILPTGWSRCRAATSLSVMAMVKAAAWCITPATTSMTKPCRWPPASGSIWWSTGWQRMMCAADTNG